MRARIHGVVVVLLLLASACSSDGGEPGPGADAAADGAALVDGSPAPDGGPDGAARDLISAADGADDVGAPADVREDVPPGPDGADVTEPPCAEDGDCDDAEPCTWDRCAADGTCAHLPLPDGASCGDGDPCSAADRCAAGVCRGQPRDCDDGQPCTADSCEAAAGCVHPWDTDCPLACTADADCDDPTRLNACTDPEGAGHGTCEGVGSFPDQPAAGVCAWPVTPPECCFTDDDCADFYPALLGFCDGAAGADPGECQYPFNPDFCEAAAGLVISEVMVAPTPYPESEACDPPLAPDLCRVPSDWFEVFNPGPGTVDLDGWAVRITDAARNERTFPLVAAGGADLGVAPGAFVVFGAWQDARFATQVRLDHVLAGSFALTPAAGAVRMVDPTGATVVEVAWDAAWALPSGRSIALINPSLDSGQPDSWLAATHVYGDPALDNRGTPGAPNVDVFDEARTAGLVCDDGEPCTLDVCGLAEVGVCAHLPLEECCTAVTAATGCDDQDPCTTDSCDVGGNRCTHTPVPGC